MVYIDLRLTLEEARAANPKTFNSMLEDVNVLEPEPHMCGLVRNIHQYLMIKNNKIQKELYPDLPVKPMKWIWVKERWNKYGELTKAHYHLNWWLVDTGKPFKQDSFRKWLNGVCQLKGIKVYCMRTHADIGDTDRWWRYTCKQSVPLSYWGFTQYEISEFHKLANDEWEHRKQENIAKRQKLEDKNNFRNKVFKHCIELFKDKPQQPDIEIYVAICEFYHKSHQTAPLKKMDDVVVDVKVNALKYLTFREHYLLTH